VASERARSRSVGCVSPACRPASWAPVTRGCSLQLRSLSISLWRPPDLSSCPFWVRRRKPPPAPRPRPRSPAGLGQPLSLLCDRSLPAPCVGKADFLPVCISGAVLARTRGTIPPSACVPGPALPSGLLVSTQHVSSLGFTESQNHRIVGVGRDLCGSSSPTPCPSRVTYSKQLFLFRRKQTGAGEP